MTTPSSDPVVARWTPPEQHSSIECGRRDVELCPNDEEEPYGTYTVRVRSPSSITVLREVVDQTQSPPHLAYNNNICQQLHSTITSNSLTVAAYSCRYVAANGVYTGRNPAMKSNDSTLLMEQEGRRVRRRSFEDRRSASMAAGLQGWRSGGDGDREAPSAVVARLKQVIAAPHNKNENEKARQEVALALQREQKQKEVADLQVKLEDAKQRHQEADTRVCEAEKDAMSRARQKAQHTAAADELKRKLRDAQQRLLLAQVESKRAEAESEAWGSMLKEDMRLKADRAAACASQMEADIAEDKRLLAMEPVSYRFATEGKLGLKINSRPVGHLPVGVTFKECTVPDTTEALRAAGVKSGMMLTQMGTRMVVGLPYPEVLQMLKDAPRPLTVSFNEVKAVVALYKKMWTVMDALLKGDSRKYFQVWHEKMLADCTDREQGDVQENALQESVAKAAAECSSAQSEVNRLRDLEDAKAKQAEVQEASLKQANASVVEAYAERACLNNEVGSLKQQLQSVSNINDVADADAAGKAAQEIQELRAALVEAEMAVMNAESVSAGLAQKAKLATEKASEVESKLNDARSDNAKLKTQIEELLQKQAGQIATGDPQDTDTCNPLLAAALEAGPPDDWEEDSLLCVWCAEWKQLPHGEESAHYVDAGHEWSCRMPPLRQPCRQDVDHY